MFTLQDAIGLATWGHRNQVDKAGLPYIEHPLRVLKTVQSQGAMPYVQIAAVLHDLTEDQPFTSDMLLDLGVPEAAVEIVRLVDRDISENVYNEKVELVNSLPNGRWWDALSGSYSNEIPDRDTYYYRLIRMNPGAVQVKLADIGDNLQPWRLSYLPPETQTRLRAKYTKAIGLLTY